MTISKTITVLFMLALVYSCNYQKNRKPDPDSAVLAESEVRNAVNQAYDYYSHADMQWIDYYNDSFTIINNNGEAITNHADTLRKQWKNMYQNNEVTVLSQGDPTIIASGKQVLHYNKVHEIIVNHESHDTIDNKGTWIALWKKQADDSWKIVWETYQIDAR